MAKKVVKEIVEQATPAASAVEETQTPVVEQVEVPQQEAAPVAPSIPSPVVTAPVQEGRVAVGSKAEAMKAKLAAEPKVRILVPLGAGEKPGVTQSVILNGYPMYIRKGDYVEVPKSVAEVLEIKMKRRLEVDNHPLRTTGGDVKLEQYGS